MLCEFIDTASLDDLSDFLLFTTGTKVNTGSMRPECIKVSVDATEGFFASTCSFELKIPALISNSADFQLFLRSVIIGKIIGFPRFKFKFFNVTLTSKENNIVLSTINCSNVVFFCQD